MSTEERVTGEQIQPGDKILIRDSQGNEHPGTAASRPERGKDFVIVRVRFDSFAWDDRPGGAPWPAYAVRLDPEADRDR